VGGFEVLEDVGAGGAQFGFGEGRERRSDGFGSWGW